MGSVKGVSKARRIVDTVIKVRMNLSNHGLVMRVKQAPLKVFVLERQQRDLPSSNSWGFF